MMNYPATDDGATIAFLCGVVKILIGLVVAPFAVAYMAVSYALSFLHGLGAKTILFVNGFMNVE